MREYFKKLADQQQLERLSRWIFFFQADKNKNTDGDTVHINFKDSSDRNPPPVNRKPAVRQPRRGQNYPRKGAISTSQSKRSPGSYPPAAARPKKPRNADLKRGGGKA